MKLKMNKTNLYLEKLKDTDPEKFTSTFSEIFDFLNLDESTVACETDMSRSTISRWRKGESRPQDAFIKLIYSYLSKKLKENLL